MIKRRRIQGGGGGGGVLSLMFGEPDRRDLRISGKNSEARAELADTHNRHVTLWRDRFGSSLNEMWRIEMLIQRGALGALSNADLGNPSEIGGPSSSVSNHLLHSQLPEHSGQ
ncbi:hypothetical protein K3495_g5273 [Podosphaera aphanis]|nr:hypothetical protein K3495_g5273 [Podosphaera aphanis]